MKSKISPTSPKAKKKKDDNIDDLYNDSLKVINRPDRKAGNSVWFLLVVIIFGFIAGSLGMIVFVTYGDQLPFLNKLNLFANNEPSSYFISGSDNDVNISKNQLSSYLDDIDPTLVQIYEKKEPSDQFESIYVPGEMILNAFTFTTDGFAVTDLSIGGYQADDLVAVTWDGKVLAISDIVTDEVSGYAFIKIQGNNFNSLDIANQEDLELLDPVILTKKTGYKTTLQLDQANIIDTAYVIQNQLSDVAVSSESYVENILTNSHAALIFDKSFVFTDDKKVIGMSSLSGDNLIIKPFSNFKQIKSDILDGNVPNRPYLGINFIDLYTTVNLPLSISSINDRGAYIYAGTEFGVDSIIADSPASESGLEPGDIIISADGNILNGSFQLNEIILNKKPGDILEISYLRNNNERKAEITLDKLYE